MYSYALYNKIIPMSVMRVCVCVCEFAYLCCNLRDGAVEVSFYLLSLHIIIMKSGVDSYQPQKCLTYKSWLH